MLVEVDRRRRPLAALLVLVVRRRRVVVVPVVARASLRWMLRSPFSTAPAEALVALLDSFSTWRLSFRFSLIRSPIIEFRLSTISLPDVRFRRVDVVLVVVRRVYLRLGRDASSAIQKSFFKNRLASAV
ncbi:MAG TPA: hypothetical protein VF134_04030 [Candidatus Dormibacteraeota bacterium]